ncbi:hypothetical protein [Aquincola sp. J276]|uniref:hypothetical protein n=1 Tax=Aquincola sp. J276 TaxID=2898432 RepID=UPI00215175BA|nr:hypothetical protein [Aquincola sp. J276]MCR5868229.1 hypothetical protein [Aquincola sp. J276]
MKKKQRVAASWRAKLEQLVSRLARGNKGAIDYLIANARAVQQTVQGASLDNTDISPRAGARMVVNLSSAHVPAFCTAHGSGDPIPYKNAYDVEQIERAKGQHKPVSVRRALVDSSLPLPPGQSPASTYFGAIELNGTGIRFYGDVCLVLSEDRVSPNTVVLDRNSYDVMRAPVSDGVELLPRAQQTGARSAILRSWSGLLRRDVGAIVAIKALGTHGPLERRLTTGQISEAARDDEDYVEVLRHGSFSPDDLQEARIASSEAARDALVTARFPVSPAPRLEALIWRDRREHAERALRACGVPVNVVTTSGRIKG